MSRDIIFPNDAVHNVNVNVRDFVPGKPGKSPYIGDDGYWYIYDEATDSWVKTDVYAKAADDAKADAEAAATQASYYRDIALTAKNEADAFSQNAYLYRNQALSAKNDAVDAKEAAQSAKTAAETAQGLAEDAVDDASDEADRAETAADRAESAAAEAGGLSDQAKQALLACFANVAWINDDGQSYYDALYDALYPPTNLVSISAVYTQSGTVYDTDSLDSLKANLAVTAHYDDSSTEIVPSNMYSLSGTLTAGTSTITVSYSGKTTTFNVTVTSAPVAIKGFTIGPLSGTINVGFSSNNNRAALACAVGTHAYPKHSGTLGSDYYPIPIPSGATSMIVTMPSELYVGARTFVWNSAQNYYDNTNGLSSPWTASNASTFDVSSYNDGTWFAGLTFKVGTAGSTDMRNYDMSDVSINFE